jgi:hypothetical protein
MVASMVKVVLALNRNDRGKLMEMYFESIVRYINTDGARPPVTGFYKRFVYA